MIQTTTRAYLNGNKAPIAEQTRLAESELVIQSKNDVIFSQPMRSFLKNFTTIVHNHMGRSQDLIDPLTATDGTEVVDGDSGVYEFSIWHPDFWQNIGIVAGSGSDIVSVQDFKLSAEIPHGTDTGQLYRGYRTTAIGPSIENDSTVFYILRPFENRTPADTISISETGIVVWMYNVYGYHLIARDVLDTPLVVAPSDSIQIAYKLSFPLPLTLQFASLIHDHFTHDIPHRVGLVLLDGTVTHDEDTGRRQFDVWRSGLEYDIGLVVGTGTTPPTPTDYNLENRILHGDGDNLLNHDYYTSLSTTTAHADGSGFTISRSFVNNGSVSVSIGECGIICESYGAGNCLVARDTFDTPITVDPGSTITITFDIRFLL